MLGNFHKEDPVWRNPEQALYRELREEVGFIARTRPNIAQTKGWLRYRLPHRYIRSDSDPVCIGQNKKSGFTEINGIAASYSVKSIRPTRVR